MRSWWLLGAILIVFYSQSIGLVHAGDAQNFMEPTDWSVGDVDSTYQEWDVFSASTGNTPDVGSMANPSISSDSIFGALLPGYVTGAGNYYAFNNDYGIVSDVLNHGGSSGAGAYTAHHGTHVVIQTSANMNELDSVYQDSLEIVDLNGSPIAGGDNASKLEVTEIFQGLVDSPFGEVTLQELRYEFWLPGYTDDFRVQADVIVHSSFMQFRVDSLISEAVRGDLNSDLQVNSDDVSLFVLALTDRAAFDLLHPNIDVDFSGDFNGNEKLDLGDIKDFKLAVSGTGFATSNNAVPEPTLLVLALSGLVVGLLSSPRRSTLARQTR